MSICKRCGCEFEYSMKNGTGYAPDLCGAFCDGVYSERKVSALKIAGLMTQIDELRDERDALASRTRQVGGAVMSTRRDFLKQCGGILGILIAEPIRLFVPPRTHACIRPRLDGLYSHLGVLPCTKELNICEGSLLRSATGTAWAIRVSSRTDARSGLGRHRVRGSTTSTCGISGTMTSLGHSGNDQTSLGFESPRMARDAAFRE